MTEKRWSLLWYLMDFVDGIKRRSTCSRSKVGALITDETMETIYAYGYNGNARGLSNKCDSEEVGNCGCIHAEVNTLIKPRNRVEHPIMISTHSPCPNCVKVIINAQIKTFIFAQWYRLHKPVALLLDAGIKALYYEAQSDHTWKVTRGMIDDLVQEEKEPPHRD